MKVSGHRGARALRPENTLAGFRHALALGVDAVELDVMLTADGAVVVTHDFRLHPDLWRWPGGAWLTPPTPAVRETTLSDLRRYEIGAARPGSQTAVAFPRQVPSPGARVPLLAEVLALGGACEIELKTEPDHPDSCDPEALADAVLAALGGRRAEIRSFDFRGLRRVRAVRPDSPMAYLTERADREALEAVLAEAPAPGSAWAPDFSGLTTAVVEAAHAAGLAVKVWTANDPPDLVRLAEWGVDSICTDAPDAALRVREGADRSGTNGTERLGRAWQDGSESGDAGPLDFRELREAALRALGSRQG